MKSISHKIDPPRRLYRFLCIVLLTFPLSIVLLSSLSHAQTGCPATTTNGWVQCATVYYSLDNTFSNHAPEAAQVRDAIGVWHTANTSNNSRVHFVDGTAPAGATNVGTLVVKIASLGGPPAETTKSNQTGTITSATIAFDLSSTIPGTTPAQLVFDTTITGYSTVFKKVMLHELGHTMGLQDEAFGTGACLGQSANNTVMNAICGPNDRAGNAY